MPRTRTGFIVVLVIDTERVGCTTPDPVHAAPLAAQRRRTPLGPRPRPPPPVRSQQLSKAYGSVAGRVPAEPDRQNRTSKTSIHGRSSAGEIARAHTQMVDAGQEQVARLPVYVDAPCHDRRPTCRAARLASRENIRRPRAACRYAISSPTSAPAVTAATATGPAARAGGRQPGSHHGTIPASPSCMPPQQ